MNFTEVENSIGYTFSDKKLLVRALTLASAGEDNNQSMEFFGDAVLEFIVSERIYSDNLSEGELTERRKSLVSDRALAPVSERLGLEKYFIKSSSDTGNKKAVPSAYEALVAAVYLDGGMDAARQFVLSTLDFSARSAEINYKGELQEALQSRGGACPVYRRRETGTAQNPQFEVSVEVNGKTYRGVASNARQAEQNAACAALKEMDK